MASRSQSRVRSPENSETQKRRRRSPNELVWTQPRTIPANLHKNVRKVSKSPEMPKKDNTVRRNSGLQEQQKAMSSLLTPPTQPKDLPGWKMDLDLFDLGSAPEMTDDMVVQNLFNFSDNPALITPPSMDQHSMPFNMDPSFIDNHMSVLGSDGTDSSEGSLHGLADPRVNLAGLNGFSAIHLAAYFGKFSIIRLLLSTCPEDVDLLNHEAQTPLHIAAAEGHFEVIPELLRAGANTLIQDINGRTALHLAVSRGHFDVARLLLDGTQGHSIIHMADSAGRSSLHHAVLQENGEIVRLLLERGADPRVPVG
ncbi:hypothetical protein N7466_001209 [Penicillium verhagenii]|uniref:uncharacterized protein n=1 Tax=Penicillium verhagenii TaxID=1562060 RepID=UPI00254531F7|nr:uncharacterized protein N7466_001209 [Penicillium verhagenii]KAJ5948194.1 hypothetical protein N7466_001209 [Penicillium verhagenii]